MNPKIIQLAKIEFNLNRIESTNQRTINRQISKMNHRAVNVNEEKGKRGVNIFKPEIES